MDSSETNLKIDFNDVERHMRDTETRVSIASNAQTRFQLLQKVLLKSQSLSDKEFENAFHQFESIVDSFNQKNEKNLNKEKSEEKNLKKLLTNYS